MLIKNFKIPVEEADPLGLKEVNMSRLGRVVALAGKNGAGKSRILKHLENCISARLQGLNNANNWRSTIENLKANIRGATDEQLKKNYLATIEIHEKLLEKAFNRIEAVDENKKISAVKFIPKKVQLTDPRTTNMGELDSRSSSAKTPGTDDYENRCLFYIYKLQERWWNAVHQLSTVPESERAIVEAQYLEFKELVRQLLGFDLSRNLDGIPTIDKKPIPDSGLSDGQSIILQLAVALHAQHNSLENSILILDEPENHLHPSASIDLIKKLYEISDSVQIWVATHSVPLLAYISSIDPMSIWYVNDGEVRNAGRHPEIVLSSLLGDEERIQQLSAFTGLPAQLAAINYATESLFPPKTLTAAEGDPQVSQIQRLVRATCAELPISILDFGAGKGRLLEGVFSLLSDDAQKLKEIIDYYAFDSYDDDKEICLGVIKTYYDNDKARYFGSREEFLTYKDKKSISVVVMCNVLHEINPSNWTELFSERSVIGHSLSEDGYILIVEDQRIPVGEKAHEYGFLVLDTSHLRTLFKVADADISAGKFVFDDARGDGRLKAHLVSKELLYRVTEDSVEAAISELKETARDEIKKLRGQEPTYINGQLNGFWTQQFANASLYLAS